MFIDLLAFAGILAYDLSLVIFVRCLSSGNAHSEILVIQLITRLILCHPAHIRNIYLFLSRRCDARAAEDADCISHKEDDQKGNDHACNDQQDPHDLLGIGIYILLLPALFLVVVIVLLIFVVIFIFIIIVVIVFVVIVIIPLILELLQFLRGHDDCAVRIRRRRGNASRDDKVPVRIHKGSLQIQEQ